MKIDRIGGSRAVWASFLALCAVVIPLAFGVPDAVADPAAVPQMPAQFPQALVGDTQIDAWRVTNFVGPFVHVDDGDRHIPGIPAGHARRVVVPEARDHLYDVSVYSRNLRTIHKGDAVEAAIWLRLAPTPGNARHGRVRLLVQDLRSPYTVAASTYVTIRPEWRRYTVKGVAMRDYRPGEATFTIHMATAKQVIDVGHGQLYVTRQRVN